MNLEILYPVISEGNKTLLKYTFHKKTQLKTRKTVIIPKLFMRNYLQNITTKLSLTNEALQNVKLYFGRLCYCKGETGYYPIKNGEFKHLKNSQKIALIFEVRF